ncbi:MAG: gamma carbonic anhydrase family protein [Methylococcales bacterium]|nr:gamma carbonic anhydrase family protein [Methylococcales bacterium]
MSIRSFENHHPSLGAAAYVDDSATVIGDVVLGDDVSVWPSAVIRGDVEAIRIGAGTNVQDGAVLHVTHAGPYTAKGAPLTIGQGVTIGHSATVHAATVGDYCLIGIGAIILDNAVLKNEVMLGAGALVAPGKKLDSGFLYVGAPARPIRALSEQERAFLHYSYQNYIELKNRYLAR